MKYSVIIPVKDEQENIKPLIDKIKEVLEDYEIIFIDDGSTDDTYEEICKYDVKCIKFRRNYGQTAAMAAGFKYATGDIIISLDGDLQNEISDITRLLSVMEEGYDCVCGWRRNRNDLLMKKIASRFANWLGRKLLKVPIHDSGCSLRVYKKECIKNLGLYGESHRYIPGILYQKGYKIGEIVVTHHPRIHGKTKYGLKRIFHGFLDLLYIKFWDVYSSRPLHFFGKVGFLFYLFGGLIFIEQIYKAFKVGGLYIGPLLLLCVLFIILGTLLIFLGFLSEILIRIYYKDKEYYEIESFK